MVEAGHVAPTGANRQPYHILVANDPAALDHIKQAGNIYSAPLALIVCSDFEASWKSPYNGYHLADVDATIVTDHMMLAATDLGLGTLWVCYFKPVVIQELFKIPPHLKPLHLLAIGHSEGEPLSPDRHSQTRKPLDTMITYNSF